MSFLSGEISWFNEDNQHYRLVPHGDSTMLQLDQCVGVKWGDIMTIKNVLLKPCPQPASVSVKLFAEHQFTSHGEQAGVTLWVTERNWVKVCKECLKGQDYVVVAKNEDGQGAIISKTVIPPMGKVNIQLHVADTVKARFCVESEEKVEGEWTEVEAAVPVGPLKVGVYACVPAAEQIRPVNFEQFDIAPLN
eukprot:TRINITY_DN770_c0_g1_i1.p1 TRINITY_DN770_c0_g1~~TRINITY_DN770_c0_g1_i1.p1  ORF type:complete len:212 (-),score=59.05 TRINITY_DN770_c0_g1_i1:193-768(-)